MSVAKSWESYEIHGERLKIKRLGGQKILVLTSSLKKGLRNEIMEKITAVDYTEGVDKDHENIEFRLFMPGSRFNDLINRALELIAACIKKHNKEVSSGSGRSGRKHKKPPFRNSPAPPNYKLAAARAGH